MEKKTLWKFKSCLSEILLPSMNCLSDACISIPHKKVYTSFYQFDLQSGTWLVKKLRSKSSIFRIFSYTKLSFYLFYNDLPLSAIRTHVCTFYLLSASSIIWLLNYFPQIPCFCSEVPYYGSAFEIKVCHSNWAYTKLSTRKSYHKTLWNHFPHSILHELSFC